MLTSDAFGLKWTSPGIKFHTEEILHERPFMATAPAITLRGCELLAEAEGDAAIVRKMDLWADMVKLHHIATPVGHIRSLKLYQFRFTAATGMSFVMPVTMGGWHSGVSTDVRRVSLRVRSCGLPEKFEWANHHLWSPDLTALLDRQHREGDIAHVVADWLEENREECLARLVRQVLPEHVAPLVAVYWEAVCRRELNWPGWERYVVDWYNMATRPADDEELTSFADD